MSRAQASIEALLVTLAFFSVILALSPVILRAAEAANYASATVRHEAILDSLCSDARDAFVLGEGNAYSFRAQLPTNASLLFDQDSLELSYYFECAGHHKNFTRELGFPITLNNATLPAGLISFETKNSGGVSITGNKK